MSIKRIEPDKTSSAPALVTGSASDIHAVRFIIDDRAVSFPPVALEHWERSGKAGQEELRISGGKFVIVISGENLSALHDALDAGIARVIRSGSGCSPSGHRLRIASVRLIHMSRTMPQPS